MSFFSKKTKTKGNQSQRITSMGTLNREGIFPLDSYHQNSTFYSTTVTTPRAGVKGTCEREHILPTRPRYH